MPYQEEWCKMIRDLQEEYVKIKTNRRSLYTTEEITRLIRQIREMQKIEQHVLRKCKDERDFKNWLFQDKPEQRTKGRTEFVIALDYTFGMD